MMMMSHNAVPQKELSCTDNVHSTVIHVTSSCYTCLWILTFTLLIFETKGSVTCSAARLITQQNKQCGHQVRPTWYAPAHLQPHLWPFDLETGMRVASKVGNLPSKFGHARPLCSGIICYVWDGRTDRQTDGWTKAMLIAPFSTVGGIKIAWYFCNIYMDKSVNELLIQYEKSRLECVKKSTILSYHTSTINYKL